MSQLNFPSCSQHPKSLLTGPLAPHHISLATSSSTCHHKLNELLYMMSSNNLYLKEIAQLAGIKPNETKVISSNFSPYLVSTCQKKKKKGLLTLKYNKNWK
jgi:hypothetical protein